MQSLRAIKPFMAAVENTPQPENSLFRIVADVWKRMAGKTEIVRPQELKSRMAQLNPMSALLSRVVRSVSSVDFSRKAGAFNFATSGVLFPPSRMIVNSCVFGSFGLS